MPTGDDRVAVLTRAIRASLAGDASALDDLFVPRVTGVSPAMTFTSREELALELDDWRRAFSDIELDVVAVGGSGNRMCAEWVLSARHTGPLVVEPTGSALAATGRKVSVFGASVAEFSGARISALRHYWDELALLRALGISAEG